VVDPDFRGILMLTVWQHSDEHLVARINTTDDLSGPPHEQRVIAGAPNILRFVRDWFSALEPRRDGDGAATGDASPPNTRD
jgi:hypothetical protein